MSFAMTDFQGRLFDSIAEDIKEVKSDTKSIKTEVKDINSRVYKLEEKVYTNPPNPKKMSAWYRDPAVLRIITYLSLALVLLVGAAIRVDIGKYL